MDKKLYTTPELKSYGVVSDLTRGGTKVNSDQPKGIGPDAYPPVLS